MTNDGHDPAHRNDPALNRFLDAYIDIPTATDLIDDD